MEEEKQVEKRKRHWKKGKDMFVGYNDGFAMNGRLDKNE